jgi:hypothetical protein
MVERHVAKHITGADGTNHRRITVDVFVLEYFIRLRLAEVRVGGVPSAYHRI